MRLSAGRIGVLLLLGLVAGTFFSAVSADVNITTEGLMVTDTGYAGGAITVIEMVKNQGEGDSGPVTISYFLVNESGDDAALVPIGSTDFESMASGGDYSSVKTFLLPLDLADGAYRFVRKVMGTEDQYNPGETIRISDRVPEGTPADLIGTGVILTSQAGPGDTVRVVSVVENQGGSDAGRFSIDFYLTNRSAPAPTPLLIGTWEVESVPSGAQASTTRTFTIPQTIAPGMYGVLMDVDPTNAIDEFDESNNDWYREGLISILGTAPEEIAITMPDINTSSVISVIPLNETGTT